MDDQIQELRQRFLKHIRKHWLQNDHNLKPISAVYLMISMSYTDTPNDMKMDIVYVGSTTNLFLRYKSHKIPAKIQASGGLNLMYYLPMQKGFYDYEIKLIQRLKPIFNKNTYGR